MQHQPVFKLHLVQHPVEPLLCTVNFRLLVQKRNIEFQIDQSRSARLPNSQNVIGQFIFQYCVMWTTNLKFTVHDRV